ncbi:MAG: glycosyltransferase family 39 protein, partial [Terriglobus sp.]
MILEPEAKSTRIPLVILLLLTAVSALAWSHFRPLDQDEWFVFQTDVVPSLRKLVDVQLHYPISLDPLFYHLVGHASVSLFGHTAFAIRLPSLFGFLLMQVCLFAIVKRIAGSFAGLVAAAIPALTATLFYAQQARPYGILLGMGALLLLAYQHSTRDTKRSRWLITLAVALALALNTHYFAILLLLPLYAAELVRIISRRRIDWPMVFAIGIGSAGALLTVPFQKGAGEFRKHYYNANKIGFHAITQSYRALIVNYTRDSMRMQHVIMALLIVAALALVIALVLRLRRRDAAITLPEITFLLVLAILPLFGFLLGRFVTHSIEVRYILPAIIGLAVLIAIACQPLYRNAQATRGILTVCIMQIALTGSARAVEANALAPIPWFLTVWNAPVQPSPI